MFDWQFAFTLVPALLSAFGVTVHATLWGMSLALVLGLFWAIARRSRSVFIAWPTTWTVEFIRSTPLLVQLYFLFYVLPSFGLSLSPFLTGVLALGVHYSAYTAEVYRAGIEEVPKGQHPKHPRTKAFLGTLLEK